LCAILLGTSSRVIRTAGCLITTASEFCTTEDSINAQLSTHQIYLNRCRSIVDFCLESLETRLCKDTRLSEAHQKNRKSRPIVFHDVVLTQLPKEILVVSDYDQLEIRVILAFIDDAVAASEHGEDNGD
jgi:hypothetical protein